jgi:hypothetical protein
MRTKPQSIPYAPRRTKNDRLAFAARLVLAAVLVMVGLLTWLLP